MNLKEQLKADLKEAMRAKDIVKRDSIRAINTMIKQIEVDEKKVLEDKQIITLLQKAIKQREESIQQYTQAQREDLVKKEQEQIDAIQSYLPQQLSDMQLEEALEKIIHEVGATSMKDMGKIMPVAQSKLGGSADGKRINLTIKKILG